MTKRHTGVHHIKRTTYYENTVPYILRRLANEEAVRDGTLRMIGPVTASLPDDDVVALSSNAYYEDDYYDTDVIEAEHRHNDTYELMRRRLRLVR